MPGRHHRNLHQVASNVVGAIEPRLRQSEIERATHKPTDSLAAYDLYPRALAESHKFTGEGMLQAVALLQRALAIDPSYAPAAALIGWCRHFQRDHGLGGSVLDTDVAQSVRLARHAIEVGKDDLDALWMAAIVLTVFAGEHAIALSAIDRALTLNPNSAHAWHSRGFVLMFLNQPGPAIEVLQRAMRLSPLDPLGPSFKSALATAYFIAGRTQRPWNGSTERCTNGRTLIPQCASRWFCVPISGASMKPTSGSGGGSKLSPS
jgi:tetratricopeptide (TPR) repeat protein